MDQQN